MRLSFTTLLSFFSLLILCYSCSPTPSNYIVKNSFEVTGAKMNKVQRNAIVQRLNNQLDDSAKIYSNTILFIKRYKNAPEFDTSYVNNSAASMKASMFHLGYYNAKVTTETDTAKGGRVHVKYLVETGKQTLIDTLTYRLNNPDLQRITLAHKDESLLVKNEPITKAAVLSEISRMVDTFRNNGYYKFTAAELRVRGDTTIAALTTVSDDPFEQLQLLAEAQQKRDSPEIKLAIVINQPDDASKLRQYRIRNIYVLEDYIPGDVFTDTVNITQRATRSNSMILRYHKSYVRTNFLLRNITLRKDSLFRQDEYYKTLTNLSRAGVWQSANILVNETSDTNKVDLIAELVPAKKFGFEAALEASYSATSNTSSLLGGNLFGLSMNLSLANRNIGREAIRMTHTLRAGVELNNNTRNNTSNLINSTELGYRNSVVVPRIILFKNRRNLGKLQSSESFVNTSFSYTNRLNLFSLQNVNLAFGVSWINSKGRKWTIRPFNAEFSYLFNQTDSFNKILLRNPFLNYSYNTAFVLGTAASYSSVYRNPVHVNSLSKERTVTVNAEESGLTLGALPILNKYKRKYIKLDVEYKYTVSYTKTALALRAFAGVGVPIGNDTFRTLPFFKQYFGGGSNSMRGWPVRGIGRGGQALTPLSTNLFNDRTGDMRLEANIEYRYDIARIIPNTLTLRGALFIDAGNIWNIKNSNPAAGEDSAQFKLKNLYKQLGVSAGTGFRLDFNYFILRFDLGFRFKRPELSYVNDGWKVPPIGFDDVLRKLFTKEFRQWRYENFNFTIGISYPF